MAIESFARNGFGGTKTRDIAAAAGVSEAILFRHFATKEDLYHAILDEKASRHDDEDFARVEEAMQRRDDRELFLLIARHILKSFRDDPAFQRLMMFASLEGHVLASMFRTRFVAPRGDYFRRYILQRQEEGAFRKCDPDVALEMTIGAFVHFAMSLYVFGFRRTADPDDQWVEEMVTFALAGLANSPGTRPNDFDAKTVSSPHAGAHRKSLINGSSRKTRKVSAEESNVEV